MAEADALASGAEHDVPDGAEHPDAHDAGHRGRQGQRVLQGVPQGEDGQCLPGHPSPSCHRHRHHNPYLQVDDVITTRIYARKE